MLNLFSNYSSGKFYILVDEDISVSINLSSDNKTFYYYNSSGDIISNDFNIYHSYSPNPSGTTSVDNFFDIVVDYIDSFSSDINQFSVVLQNCYDLAPEFIRNLIFVVFILSMSVILYKLIGKWWFLDSVFAVFDFIGSILSTIVDGISGTVSIITSLINLIFSIIKILPSPLYQCAYVFISLYLVIFTYKIFRKG